MKNGVCCICGTVGPLSWEHLPPKAAYNDQRVFEADMPKLIAAGVRFMDSIEGKEVQKGAGTYSLCERCNNTTGSWYGPAYVSWAKQAALLVERSRGTLSMAYPYHLFPLRIVKQVVTMFFSVCGPSLQAQHPDLVRLVLNKEHRRVPDGLRFFAYLLHPTETTAFRQSGVTGLWQFEKVLKSTLFAELAFAPFGFIMTIDGSVPAGNLCEITGFAEESYKLWTTLFLRLPVHPVVSWLPGDFRTKDELTASTRGPRLGAYRLDGGLA